MQSNITRMAWLSAALLLPTHIARANVSAAEAAKLGTTLTPTGAERAGNADGSIPAWTGGLLTMPAGVTAQDKMPDFFKDDPVKLIVDKSNADQYADKLTTGAMFMLKNYPGYKIYVYPTHRSAAAPQWFYDLTKKNATDTQISHVNWVINLKGGIPFPIPTSGKEVAWNNNLYWQGTNMSNTSRSWLVPPNGEPLLNAVTHGYTWDPIDDPSYEGNLKNYYLMAREDTIGPPNRVGEAILAYDSVNEDQTPQITWQYLVGQRRLRKAPQVTYDGTYPDCGGIMTVDELGVWQGPPDRFDMKLIGKAEKFIPYNNENIGLTPAAKLLGPNFFNPQYMRYELHRVWVVEFTLAAGKREIYPHRKIYFDEDTWAAIAGEDYDANNNLARISFGSFYTIPSIPMTYQSSSLTYDLRGAGYCMVHLSSGEPNLRGDVLNQPALPPSYWAPSTVAAEAVR